MEFDKHESAKWAILVNQATDDYLDARDKILGDSATRGFPAVTGEGLGQLLDIGFKTKLKLTEANGKLYEEERTRFLEIVEFEMKLAVQVNKLAMELYKEKLMNALLVEQAQVEARADYYRGDIERMSAETEKRQIAIINAKAAAEHEVNQYRLQVVEAERLTLGADLLLVRAQLETAQARLAIIDSIYEVIAAQALVIAAENRKAAALELVIAAEQQVAAIKEGMIPGYMQKAAAKMELAGATTEDAVNRKSIELLGFQRNALKLAEANAESAIRGAELSYDMAQQALVRATGAVEVLRNQSRADVVTAQNSARRNAIDIRKGAEETRGAIRWEADLLSTTARVGAATTEADAHADIISAEIGQLVQNISSVGASATRRIEASTNRQITDERESHTYEHIQKGG